MPPVHRARSSGSLPIQGNDRLIATVKVARAVRRAETVRSGARFVSDTRNRPDARGDEVIVGVDPGAPFAHQPAARGG
jgi:hypothetical protein